MNKPLAVLLVLVATCCCAASALRASTRAGYLGNQVYSGAERRITFWYSANDLNTAADAVNAVGLHPTAVWGVALYCGFSVSSSGGLERDTTNRWYCEGADSVIPKFQNAGADVELVITDTKNYRFLFDRPAPFINDVVKLAKQHSLYGVNIDFEPEQGLKIRGKDAQRYAAFLAELKVRLNAINVRLTVNVGDWNPMLAQYFTLQHVADRLVNLQTYKATDFVSWLSTYNNMVNAHITRSKVAIGFATYPYTIDESNNPKWMSDQSGADSRIAQLIADGVPEIYVFKLDPTHGVPESWWWNKLASFSSKATPPYQGLPSSSPRRLRERTLAHNTAVNQYGREANIFTAQPIAALPVPPAVAAAAANAYNVAAAANAAAASGLATATPLSPAAAVIAAGLGPAPVAGAAPVAAPAAAGAAAPTAGAAAASATGAAAAAPAAAANAIPIVPASAASLAVPTNGLNWQSIIDSVKGNTTISSDSGETLVKQARDYANQRIASAIAQAEQMIADAKAGKWSPAAAAGTAAAAGSPAAAAAAAAARGVAGPTAGAPSSSQAASVSGLLIGSNPAAASKISFDSTGTSNLVAPSAGALPSTPSYQQLLTSILAGSNPSLAAAATKSFSTPAPATTATPVAPAGSPWANVLGSLKNLQAMVTSANATIPRCSSSTGAAAPSTSPAGATAAAAAGAGKSSVAAAAAVVAAAAAPLRVSNNKGNLHALKSRALKNGNCSGGEGCNPKDIKEMNSMLKQLLTNQDAMLDAHGIPREAPVDKKNSKKKAEKKHAKKKHVLKAAKIRGQRPGSVLKILKGKLPAFPKALGASRQQPVDISPPAGIKLPVFNLRRKFKPEINKNSPAFQSEYERNANRRAIADVEGDLYLAKSMDETHLTEALPIIARHDRLHKRLLRQVPANKIVADTRHLASQIETD